MYKDEIIRFDWAMKRLLRHKANIMGCKEYGLREAVVFTNDNLHAAGAVTYAPIYMAMFLEKSHDAPACYRIDLSGLK